MAFDPVTGEIDTAWTHPEVTIVSVRCLAVSNGKVFVGGILSATAGGNFYTGVVALEPANGNNAGNVITTWHPPFATSTMLGDPPETNALVVSGGKVYAGGPLWLNLSGVDQPRYLAAFDETTGAIDTAWNPPIYGNLGPIKVNALAIAGNKLYAGGLFSAVYPAAFHHMNLVAYQLANGVNTGAYDVAWNPVPSDRVYSLLAYGGKIYAGGKFTDVNGYGTGNFWPTCLAAFEPANGTNTGAHDPTWEPSLYPYDKGIMSLAVFENKLLVGGEFPSGSGISHICALNPANGQGPSLTSGDAAVFNTDGDPECGRRVCALAVWGSELFLGMWAYPGEQGLESRGPGPLLSITPPTETNVSSGSVVYTVTYAGADSITLSERDIQLHLPAGLAVGSVRIEGTDAARQIVFDDIYGAGTIAFDINPGTATNLLGYTANGGSSEASVYYETNGLDTDGDGVPDRLERALGTDVHDPADPPSVPLPAGPLAGVLLLVGRHVVRRKRLE